MRRRRCQCVRAPSGRHSAVCRFQRSAGRVSGASQVTQLCYGYVKSTYFGKVAHGHFGRNYPRAVEASTVAAAVNEPHTAESALDEHRESVIDASDDQRSGLDAPTPPVRRKRGRPRDPEADGRILAAASALILMRGFESMTVDEVASNAGVGKATVYRRWSRKEDLAVAAMEQLYRDEIPSPDTGSIRGDLEALFASVLAFVSSPAGTDYVRTQVKESMRDDRIAALYRDASKRAEQRATEVFERAIARGEVRADIPMQAAMQFLSSLVVMRAVSGEEMPGLDELDGLVALLLNGICA
jgi:AcrR family transcriptional regulator